jgi:DNA polymerase elongation subunit (family B)
MNECNDPQLRSKLDAMQSSLKILINSFYGYLGYSRGLFNDFAQADKVTTTGQEILRSAMSAIRSRGGRVVEVDTDGIYFVPPFGTKSEEAERVFVSEISATLPEGINLIFEGRYKKMLSYKKKNYALLRYDRKVEISGSSLISRGMERFARNYVSQAIDCLLQNNIGALHTLYTTLRHDMSEHKLDIHDFARTEQIKDSLEEYQHSIENGKRNRSAAYELALASGGKYRKGDRISYYFTGSDSAQRGFEHCKLAEEWIPSGPDENVAYYVRRLDELSEKFEVFFTPSDYRAIFTAEDLFGFSPDSIVVMTRDTTGTLDTHESPDPQIWLAEE